MVFQPNVLQGVVTTVAGDGQEGFDDGDAMGASFSFPGGIALYYDSSEGQMGSRSTEAATPVTNVSQSVQLYPVHLRYIAQDPMTSQVPQRRDV